MRKGLNCKKLKKMISVALTVCLVFGMSSVAQAAETTGTAANSATTTTAKSISSIDDTTHNCGYEPREGVCVETTVLPAPDVNTDVNLAESEPITADRGTYYSSGFNSSSTQTNTKSHYGRQYLLEQQTAAQEAANVATTVEERTEKESEAASYARTIEAYDMLVEQIEDGSESGLFIYNVNDDNAGEPTILLEEGLDAYNLVLEDYPEYFWIGSGYRYSNVTYPEDSSEYAGYILPNYVFDSQDDIEEAKVEFDAEVAEILGEMNSEIGTSASDYDKELWIHDYLVETNDYISYAEYAHSAYGAIVDGESVCEGYTRAFQLLLDECGIEACTVTGIDWALTDEDKAKIEAGTATVTANHIWNAVKLDGSWYQVDVTWDDLGNDADDIYHAYFNITDEAMYQSHTAVGNYYALPTCTATTYLYFIQNKEDMWFDEYTGYGDVMIQVGKQIEEKGFAVAYAEGTEEEAYNLITKLYEDYGSNVASYLKISGSYMRYWTAVGNELHLYMTLSENYVEEFDTVGYLTYGWPWLQDDLTIRIYPAGTAVDKTESTACNSIEEAIKLHRKDDKLHIGTVKKTELDADEGWYQEDSTGCYYAQFKLPSLPAGDYILAVYDEYYGLNYGEITIKANPTKDDEDADGNTVGFDWAIYSSGDVDDLEGVNLADAIYLARAIAGWEVNAGNLNTYAADVNDDGYVDMVDWLYLNRCIAQWDSYTLA